MSYTKIELKALLDEAKAKVKEVKKMKNRRQTRVESVESVLNKAEEEIDTKSSDNEFGFLELEDKLLSTQDELLEITDVAAKQAWVQAHFNVLLKYIEIQVQVQLQK